jgi:hypothetical protein
VKEEQGPGVPEAIPRTVHGLGLRLDPGTLDRVWIFPPLIRGRRERGLVAASRFARVGDGLGGGAAAGEEPDGGEPRRSLYSAPYMAERTGKGLTLDWQLVEQGAALPDRLPRVMDGVVRRAGGELGEAREIEIGGDPARFQALLDELGTHLLEPPAPAEPTATAEPPEPAAPAEPSEAPPPAES